MSAADAQPFWSSAPSLDVTDRGLQFGDGLFETFELRAGRIARLEWHVRRLRDGCERLGLRYPEQDIALLLERLGDAARNRERAVGKLVCTRDGPPRGYRATWYAPVRCHAAAFAAGGAPNDPTPVRVRICRLRLARQPALAGLKHLNRLEQVLARSEWQDETFFEGLMLDQADRVVEGTFSNLFLVAGGQVRTPLLDECGVAGVVRAYLLETHLAGRVRETRVELRDVLEAQEAFLCNSLIGIRPIGEIVHEGGVATLPAGTLTRDLQRAMAADPS